MKKALFYITILISAFSFTHSAFALTSCAQGDIFDVNTGKACVVASACNTGDLFNIYTGESCIAPIVATTTNSVNTATTTIITPSSVSDYYEARKAIFTGETGSINLQTIDSSNDNGCDTASNYDILTGGACVLTLPTNPTYQDKQARIDEINYALLPPLHFPISIRDSSDLSLYYNRLWEITALQNELSQLEATSSNQ